MNSILQCLSNCKDFRNFMLKNNVIHLLNNSDNIFIAKKILENTLTFQLRKILSYFWFNQYKVLELSSFRKLFCKKIHMFQNFNQHDSQEALLCIIDTIHEEIAENYDIIPKNKDIIFDSLKYYHENNLEYDILSVIKNDPRNYLNFKSFIDFKNTHKNFSDIYDIFEGRIISQLKCPLTQGIKANFESQFYFTLSLSNDNDFQECTTSQSINSSNEQSTSQSINSSNEQSTSQSINSSNETYEYSDDENINQSTTDNNTLQTLSKESNNDNSIQSNNFDSEDNSSIQSNDIKSNNDSDNNYDSEDNSSIPSNDINSNNNSDDNSIGYESNEYDVDEDSNNDYLNFLNNFEKKKIKKCEIYDLFDNFCKVEILDNDNQWFSPYSKQKVNAEKTNLIWDSPKVFIILIKRFEYTEYGAEKLNHFVNFPIYDLDITKYLHPNHVSKFTKYNLFAVNNHDSMNSNGINFGHYYSYCKNSINNKWYNFDDDEVNEIDEDDLVTNKAYMLFYEANN